jgi:hypothetical protein
MASEAYLVKYYQYRAQVYSDTLSVSNNNVVTSIITIVAMLLGMCSNTYGQEYSIKGRVIDTEKKPINFVYVTLQKDSLKTKFAITDSLGLFTINAEKGDYIIALEQLGSKIIENKLRLLSNTDLGDIVINDAVMLKNVTVEGRRKLIEQKVDRIVFNVENSVTAFGGTALDALKATPRLQVLNEHIGIIGKGSVVIMVDDRPVQLSGDNLTNYLKGLSADDIKSIEVMPTPPAKYSAEGNSGLINIILKKNKVNMWQNSSRASYIQTTYPAYSIGNTFSYRKDKLSIYTAADIKTGDIATIDKYEINYPNQTWNNYGQRKNKQDFYSARINLDYQINKKSNIGFIVSRNKSKPDNTENSNVNILSNDSILSKIQTNGYTDETDRNTSFNFHLDQVLDTIGRKMSINLDYFNYSENKVRAFNTRQISIDGQELQKLIADNTGNVNINNYAIKADYTHPLKWVELSYGGRISSTNTKSGIAFINKTSGEAVLDEQQTNSFEYSEHIQALYAEFSKKINKKLQGKIGLRYEHTSTDGISENNNGSYKYNYNKLFPTFHSLYLIDKNNFINLNYSKRINRPAYWEVNPFKWYTNANSYAEGNPFLQPSFNNNLELTYGYKQKLFTTLFAQIKNNGFSQLPLINETTRQQIFTRQNYFNSYGYGVAQSYSFDKFEWWQSNVQANAYYTYSRIYKEYKILVPAQNGYGFSFSMKNNFVLNKDKTTLGEINYSYESPNKGTIYQMGSSMSLDAGLRVLLLKSRLQCAININDLLRTANPNFVTFTSDIKQKYNTYYDTRQMRISLRYSFGNNKISVKQRDFGNESERGRAK